MEKALQILCEALGRPVGTTDIQMHNDVWTTLMARKRRWAARQGFDRKAGKDSRPVDLESARRRIRWKKGGQLVPVLALRDGQGHECTGATLLQELLRQMEAKRGRPGRFFPDEGAGPFGLDYTLGELQQVVRSQKPSALGKSGMVAAAMKQLSALSLAVLRDAIAASGSRPYIKMVVRFVVHLPVRKRPKVYTEEDTRPIALEEEVAKVIAVPILREMDSWVTSSQ